MGSLKPFWRYYGGKNRAARLYPAPEHDTVIEPFAGAAGYACRYYDKDVILIDRSPIIAGIWRYLIGATAEELLRLPDVPDGGTVDDMPSWVPQEARWLAGFWCNDATVKPSKSPSTWCRQRQYPTGRWGEGARRRVASQVGKIRHWRVIHGEYSDAPNVEATWFVDPPYNNRAGSAYPEQPACFQALGQWCKSRDGFVMVCENAGAKWLPFRPLAALRSSPGRFRPTESHEVIWTNRVPTLRDGGQRVFAWGAV